MIMLGIDTQIFVVETIVTAICDEFAEQLRRNHRHVLIFVCLLFYAAGLVLCTQVGDAVGISCNIHYRLACI
jgi:hypothetical protein